MRTAILLLLVMVAVLVGGEALTRTFVDDVNYLYPILERDENLGHRIASGSGGHDAWGFRNKAVPPSAELVAIGDSSTYGYSATASESWPAQVARLSGLRVYNLALGGYGPVQYLHLLKERASSLNPRFVVFGLYLGNDLIDSYRATNGFDYVAKLEETGDDGRFLGRIRIWLSQHVLIYQVLKSELRALIDPIRFRESLDRPGHFPFEHPVLRTVFRPSCCYDWVNLSDERTRSGLETTLAAFREIKGECDVLGIVCQVLLLPTKESVYWPIARNILSGKTYDAVAQLVAAETAIRNRLAAAFDEIGLPTLDLLPDMRAGAKTEALYPMNEDGHPTAEGYEIVAKAVSENLPLAD